MIGFFFKKAFFDGWDNLFGLVAMNFIHLALFLVGVVVPMSAGAPAAVSALCAALTVLAVSVWHSACAVLADRMSDYSSVGFRDALAALASSWKAGLQLGAANILLLVAIGVGVPFYLSMSGFIPVFAAGILFWTVVVAFLTLQYYVPIRARLGGGMRKNVRKALMILVDNPGFSLFLALYGLVTLVVSLFPAFLVPGFAGLSLAQADAVKLRLKKYEWLEGHPEANRKSVPWAELLEEERDLVGERTLKGMIFPWKEGK